jgi:ribosomal protein L4
MPVDRPNLTARIRALDRYDHRAATSGSTGLRDWSARHASGTCAASNRFTACATASGRARPCMRHGGIYHGSVTHGGVHFALTARVRKRAIDCALFTRRISGNAGCVARGGIYNIGRRRWASLTE